MNDMNSSEKFLVCLYSEPNFLAVNVLENLLANNCYINIVTKDTEGWYSRTTNIAAKNRFSIIDIKSFSNNIVFQYYIVLFGFLSKESVLKDFGVFVKNVNYNSKKTIFVFPYEIYEKTKLFNLETNPNMGIIYVGDLVGPRIDLGSDLKIANYISEIIDNRIFSPPVGDVTYPIFVSDAAKQIVKWLFAFGPYGKEVSLLGSDTSSSVFWQSNKTLVGEIKYITNSDKAKVSLPKNIEVQRLGKDLNFCLTETYQWIRSQPAKNYSRKKITQPMKINNNLTKKNLNKFKPIFVLLLLIIIFPIITAVTNIGLSYLSYRLFLSGRDGLVEKTLYLNKAVSKLGNFESGILKHTPLVGTFYRETEFFSYSVDKLSDLGISAIPLAKTGGKILSSVLGNYPYSIGSLIEESAGNLNTFYLNITELQQETLFAKEEGVFVAGIIDSKIDLSSYTRLVSELIAIENKIPEILGRDQSKTYLLLFENNMELRPTGGFIGSYGLLTFDKGRLSDFVISDIYSADGQLKGHVEPPGPIRDYLGEANWWFRDSNWDPDFPTSAKRGEWFLDKETDKQVDGVISLDLNPVKDFLKVSGPINLPDYSMTITSENLYEEVQSEVEDNFFPGTHNKASFLTALSRSILTGAGDLSPSQQVSVLKLFYKSLEERHIQVYMHDMIFQTAMRNLGWDGAVFIPSCGDECIPDLVALVEANVGVNKSNYFIKRKVDLDINMNKDSINKYLTLTLENSANTSLGPSGRYKSYIRLLVPENTTDISVKSSFGQSTQTLNYDITNSKGRKEIGVIFEVLGGETKNLIFSWTTKTQGSLNLYELYFRKQAGVDGYPLSVKITTPISILGSLPNFTLTDDGTYVYNTTLTRDLFARFSL